ncbi:hypothetical protein LguiB_030523 [Lonicera macranthoides]
MASFWSLLLVLAMNLMASYGQLSSSTAVPNSAISAAPSYFSDSPIYSPSAPALSPDIDNPLFPSPGGGDGLSPTDSSQPLIPSSPSPPNPDEIFAPGPHISFPPSGSLPVSSSISLLVSESMGFLPFLLMWLAGASRLMQFCGM